MSVSFQWDVPLLDGYKSVFGDRVGCAADLVSPGENGFVVVHGRVEPLVEALRRLIACLPLRESYGRRSRECVTVDAPEALGGGVVDRLRVGGGA